MLSIDTNILVYATARSGDPREAAALGLMRRLMRSGRCIVVLQCLTEFSSVAMRKHGMPPDAILNATERWRAAMPVSAAAEEDLPTALEAVRDHKLPFWDAMLWATADRSGVTLLLSEDFQNGRRLGRVTFLDPFDPANQAAIDAALA